MATFTTSEQYGANPIIDSSLILYMDAGNPKSYPNYNLLQYTQDYTHSSWIKIAVNLPSTNNLAPDGTNTATFLREDNTPNSRLLSSNNVTLFPKGYRIYTASAYMKAGTRNFGSLVLYDGTTGGTINCIFNLSTGVIGVSSTAGSGVLLDHSMQLDNNGFYLCKISALINVQTTTAGYGIGLNSTNSTSTYTGDGVSGIYVWGAQLTEGRDLKPYKVNTTTRPTLVTNLVAPQNNGTFVGGTIVSGGNGGQFNFDGTNDRIDLGLLPTISTTTYSFWAKWNATGVNTHVMTNETALGDPLRGFGILQRNGNVYGLSYQRGTPIIVSTPTLSIDTFTRWHLVTATLDGVSAKIYINGISVASAAYTGGITTTDRTLVLGYDPIGVAEFFNGTLALPMVYNRALTSAEVWQNYVAFKDRFKK